MSFFSKIPRGLRILVVMAILGVLIWQFALGTQYYYYSIGAAVLLTFGAIALVYKPFKSSGTPGASKKSGASSDKTDSKGTLSENIDIAEDETDTPPAMRTPANRSSGAAPAKPAAANFGRNPTQPIKGAADSVRAAAKPSVADVARQNLQSNRASDSRVPPKPAAAAISRESRKSSKADWGEEPAAVPASSGETTGYEKGSSAQPVSQGSSGGASFFSKIPRGLRVLVPMAVLGVLVWQFAMDTKYYYYSIGAAVLITFGVIVLVYKPFKSSKSDKASPPVSESLKDNAGGALPEKIDVESDYTDTPSIMRNKPVTSFREATGKPVKPAASDPGRNLNATREIWSQSSPAPRKAAEEKVVKSEAEMDDKVAATAPENETAAPSIPLVEDETSLTEEDKNQLVNAVWYRCENPYCKYTSFLGVHHIVEEKEGGTNRLDNLIVLCPYCHDLAHRGEIPVDEMKDWICNRENRFKFKPDWKYF